MSSSPSLLPDLSLPAQAFLRTAYGLLLLGTLLMAIRHGRRFFLSERFGGYGRVCPEVDVIQNPVCYPLVMAGWLLCAVLLILGVESVWAALANLALCNYFFVRMRWKGVLRGMGAPGFMTWWLAVAVFLLEFTQHHAPHLRCLALLVVQIDFAFIMLSAGLYKMTAGYPHNHGMELGLVNPQWGYWYRFYARLRPSHPIFWVQNQLAWLTEVVAAVLMLIPSTRFLGAILIVGSFAFIATHIRLALLTEMVMLCGVLFFDPSSWGGQPFDSAAWVWPSSSTLVPAPAAFGWLVGAALWAYLVLLPFAHAGLFYNFYGRKSLRKPLQQFLEAYTNFFGIIIWRVFSADHTSFFINIYRQSRSDPEDRELLSNYDRFGSRFNHVGEAIAVTSVFTTLKYYPSNSRLFENRLLCYARTLPCPGDSVLVFEYMSVRKTRERFAYVPVAEYEVDARCARVRERLLDHEVSVHAAHPASPIREGIRPGSYVPLRG
jgi:hypothetical protein